MFVEQPHFHTVVADVAFERTSGMIFQKMIIVCAQPLVLSKAVRTRNHLVLRVRLVPHHSLSFKIRDRAWASGRKKLIISAPSTSTSRSSRRSSSPYTAGLLLREDLPGLAGLY